MNSLFKRSAIGLVVLGMASSSFAMHQGNVDVGCWSPQVTGAFLGVEGLYFRPQNGDLDFATITPADFSGPFRTVSIKTDYDWGWRVYGGIKFTDRDDITLSWLHFDHSYHSSVAADQNVAIIWEAAGLPAVEPPTASASFDLDEAYAVWGHTVQFNNPWSFRFAAGVEYARLKANKSMEVFSPAVPPSTLLQHAEFTSHVTTKGWGPRLELDTNYAWPFGLNWFLRTNAVLLSAERDLDLINNPLEGTDDTTASGFWDNRHVVIPKLGMKIGVGYSYFFGQAGSEGACGTTLTAEIGWQADVYIHAVERPLTGFFTFPSGFTFGDSRVDNFSIQGMFVGLKVSSDWI